MRNDPDAFLLLALHGHLPWVNHPEHPNFLEEDWLFEGVADCYLPLLMMLDGWRDDGIPAAITLGISPPLLSMLQEESLRARTERYLKARLSLVERFLGQLPDDSPFKKPAEHAREENGRALERFVGAGRDVGRAFAEHQEQGRVELMTCGVTHGLQPVLLDEASIEAQVQEAVKVHERFLGRRPRGIWLPECGVTPLAFPAIARAGLCFTFVEDRAVRLASPPPVHEVYRPLYSPQGVACFGRDPVAAKEVWSADEGYPGDPRYREFYRDLGYDADESLLDDVHKQGTGARKQLGLKLHRITGRVGLDDKAPYEPWAAEDAARTHAAHFADRRVEEAREIADRHGIRPCITCTFDGELFGHWWHEGPRFLDLTLRELATRDVEACPRPVSALAYLEAEPRQQVSRPAVSSWGDGGAFKVWVNGHNDWLWRKVHDARLRLQPLAEPKEGLADRALKQATREVLLAQSSDWPFIITMGTQSGYALKRPVQHLSRAHRLMDMIERGDFDEADLAQLEERDGVLPDVEPALFRSAP